MKKVLFVTTRDPYLIMDGRSYTLSSYCNILKKNFDLKILSYETKNKDMLLKNPSSFERLINVIFKSFIFRKPLQVSAIYSFKNKRKIRKTISDFKPDIVICDMIRTAYYLKGIKGNFKKVLDMDDILSKRYKLSYENNTKNSIGQLGKKLRFINRIISFFKLDKMINKFEYKAMLKMEKKANVQYDLISLVSPKEVEEYNSTYNTTKAVCWPVCVNINNFNKDYNNQMISFVGNMNVSHNIESLENIIRNILPRIDGVKLLVVGKASDEIINKYSCDNVIFTGLVDSIGDYVSKTLCMVAPITTGSGIKIKILESMSYGVPIITTTIGIEGLKCIKHKDILVADDYEDMCMYIKQLSNDDQLRENIRLNAIEFLKNNHSIEVLEEIILQTI